MIRYDHQKLRDMISDAYANRYGKSPSQAASRVIECIDDACMDEWRREVLETDQKIQERISTVQRSATATLGALESEVEALKENEIKDERIVDALKAYKTIVGLDFDTPQQKLQNIQNASYFIWALYFQGGGATNMFFRDMATDVKNEDDTDRRIRWN